MEALHIRSVGEDIVGRVATDAGDLLIDGVSPDLRSAAEKRDRTEVTLMEVGYVCPVARRFH